MDDVLAYLGKLVFESTFSSMVGLAISKSWEYGKRILKKKSIDIMRICAYNVRMPTIINIHGFRFFFYSREESRMHVHIEHGEFHAKIWMDTFEVANSNMPKKLEKKAVILVREYEKIIKAKWNQHF